MNSGTAISKNIKITSCLNTIGNSEVYSLSNNKQLLVLPFLASKKYVNKSFRKRLLTVKSDTAEYFGLISNLKAPEFNQQFIDVVTRKTGLDAVAGLRELKRTLREQVMLPLQYPEKFARFKVSIPNGILLYGPPGCGKTFIVRKLAEELGYNFVEMVSSSVASPYIHGNVSNVANIFREAKENAPSIIFIDEIEGMVPKRDELSSSADIKREEVNEFLVQLNNAGQNRVLVIGATNAPELIDKALLRSGRLDKKIFVGPPDHKARKELLQSYLAGRPQAQNINFARLADLTENYSGSDLVLVIEEAARLAIFGDFDVITEDLVVKAISINPTSLS